jgi:hypothetical protein
MCPAYITYLGDCAIVVEVRVTKVSSMVESRVFEARGPVEHDIIEISY